MPESRAHGRESAETMALRALAWLLADDDLLPVFLSATGADPAELRAAAEDPVFLAAVLDFLLTDDRWIRQFCEAHGLPPEAPLRARAALPGADPGL